ncbi:LysR family transcriptional regulator [Metabacillus litoralis]|uniref:LysR family transcriptional regulator n=1 Tax=Metabacillus litoralis TaxID=152268 RepID=UPI00203AE5FF|nr:LysR family transcriptional regulator [Metabacillus litoralis]MCM3163707.1 LysR family transcriptional regulator [Metabacillus litoralis]
MELNDLVIFKAVANEGSISKAAKELGYVQPNVTERIKKLEQQFETPLLHRNNKGVSLLPSGEILLDYINKILSLLDEAKNEIKQSCDSYRIATSQTILSDYLSIRIQEHFNKYRIYMENSNHLKQLLKNNIVDMVITYEDYTDEAFEKVYCTKISMGLLKGKGKSISNLSNVYFFVSHDKKCPYRNYTSKFIENHNLSKKQIQEIDSYSLIKDFIEQGRGVAFLPLNNDHLEKVEGVIEIQIPIYFFINRESGKKRIPDSELFN